MNKDLTVGKPSTVLWQFCLPMFGSIVFQQLYNIADSLVAGKFVGEDALAAVGNSYEITLIFIAFAFGCNIGCSVIVSRFFGAKQYEDMKTAVTTSLIGCAALVVILMAVGLLGCDALLELINTPDEILADSALYLDIYVLGLPFMFFYNVATGIFSALGDSKTPFLFLAASSTSNIFMDILFVTAFHMGVAGVAWATFLCQGVSCVLAMWVVTKRMISIHTQSKPALFSWSMLGKRLLRFGQAEQPGHHLLHHPGQRHLQLHLPEPGRRQARPDAPGLHRRRQAGVGPVCPPGRPVLLRRPPAAVPVYE